MKEVKHFFNDGNRLNKGYQDSQQSRGYEKEYFKNKFEQYAPPFEVLEKFEALNAGSTIKILTLAEKEQEHRHKCEESALVYGKEVQKWGGLFSFLSVLVISYVSLKILTISGGMASLIFSVTSFGAMFGVSLMMYLNNRSENKTQKEHLIRNVNRKNWRTNRQK